MWVFYLISLPLTLGMVVFTLRYFVGPGVPRYVIFTVGYAWFCSLSIIILVPADIWATIVHSQNWVISFFWSWSYWSTFLLTWAVVPLIQGYEDAGDFTWRERLKTSVHVNLVFYLIVGSLALVGLIFLIMMRKSWKGGVLGFAMACSNTFGLVTGAFLLGFGLSEIPKGMWRNADWTTRQKVLSHKIAKMAVKLDDAHQALSNAIVVAQATSNQMSKRDLLRPYMDVIDKMLTDMFREDPSFKPQGGQLGEDDMDYDTDEKSMATLRRNIRGAREQYFRYKSQYMKFVMEALELEDTIRNYERRSSTGWKFVSSLRPGRTGKIGPTLDTIEFIWRCYASKQFKRLLAIILGCMSASILLAEATLLPDVDLSLFSILIKAVGEQEMPVQVLAFVPLMYMCVCTYYSLFKVGMLMFYSLTPRQTSSVSLLMICSMVARYAPPISYNFLNLIRLKEDGKTVFEKRMGNIDDAVPFFGSGFNDIYPLFMVIYTLLVIGNFFDRVIDFFGSWKRFRLQTEADDTDGLNPSGIIILQKERSWIEQGHNVGEHVIPLARNFIDVDLESTVNNTEKTAREMHSQSILLDDTKGVPPNSIEETRQHGTSREAMHNKYAAIREHNRQASKTNSPQKNTVLDGANSNSNTPTGDNPTGITSRWQSMKMGFKSFKTNMGNKKFIALRQNDEPTRHPAHDVSSSESLDEIFRRLKKPSMEQEHRYYHDDDDDGLGTHVLGLTR